MTQRPLLVVEHEAQCPPAWMGEWLVDAGHELDLRRPYLGDPLPADLSEHAGMLVLGGDMDAYSDDTCPWLTDVKRLVREAAADGTPVLGICLGLQLAAVALGGTVHKNPLGQQIGVLEMGWTPAAGEDPLFGGLTGARSCVQWNNDVVAVLPEGALALARTPRGELQAARLAPTVWGIQSHPEAGTEVIGLWVDNDRDEALERGVDLDGYLADVAAARDELRAAWRGLAIGFSRVVAASGPVPRP